MSTSDKTTSLLAVTAFSAGMSFAALPALAQDTGQLLGQRSTEQLVAMGVPLRRLCDDGQERACTAQRQLRRLAAGLVLARAGCASGSASDCRTLEEGTTLLDALFVRFKRADGDFFSDGTTVTGGGTDVFEVPEPRRAPEPAISGQQADPFARDSFGEDPFARRDQPER